jgi:hypothetical protein
LLIIWCIWQYQGRGDRDFSEHLSSSFPQKCLTKDRPLQF